VEDVRENVGAPNLHRQRRSPDWCTGYMDLMNEKSSFGEAIEKLVWVDAMVEEYKCIVNNNVWEVVPRSIDKSIVGSIWIFKVRHVVAKSIDKYKEKFVAKEYSKFEGIDYEEIFSSTARYSSTR